METSKITVDKTIKIGRVVLILIMIFIFCPPSVWGGIVFFRLFPVWAAIMLYITNIWIHYLISDFIFGKWCLWAFRNVDNVHELKRRTELNGFIPKNSKFYRKIEFNHRYISESCKRRGFCR
jgi:hypothetical protein